MRGGRTEEEISRNHVQTFIFPSVHTDQVKGSRVISLRNCSVDGDCAFTGVRLERLSTKLEYLLCAKCTIMPACRIFAHATISTHCCRLSTFVVTASPKKVRKKEEPAMLFNFGKVHAVFFDKPCV